MVRFPCLLRLRALMLKKLQKNYSVKIEQIKQIDKHGHSKFSVDYECFSIHFLRKIFDSTNR